MKSTVKLPFGKTNRHFFNDNHETTMGFGEMLPVFSKYLAPNEKISVNTNFFGRAFPMVVPTFGDVRVNFHSYFVPFSAIWDHFDDFINGLPSPKIGSFNEFVRFKTPVMITQKELIHTFIDDPNMCTPTQDVDAQDFIVNLQVYDDPDVQHDLYFTFTPFGKRVFHILQSLGLNFPFVVFDTERGHQLYNILPVLAFMWCWYDNFIPERYKQYNYVRNIKELLHDRMPDSQGRVMFNSGDMRELFLYLRLSYSEDYFTSVWAQPNDVNSNFVAGPLNVITMPEGYNNDVDRDNASVIDGTSLPGWQGDGGFGDVSSEISDGGIPTGMVKTTELSPWAITLAQKLQGWFTSHSIAGTDKLNNTLAEYGIKPIETIGVSRYLGSGSCQLKIDSVFDTAGSVQQLGSYAGKGIFANKLPKFSVHTKEHGMFFIIASVESYSHFTQGIDRLYLYRDKFDFFTPTFDGLNMQATPVMELFNTFYDGDNDQNLIDDSGFQDRSILGYNVRYAERKFPRFRVTGDFNIKTLASNIEGFTLQRNFVKRVARNEVVLNTGHGNLRLQDIIYQNDAAQYNRVFKDTTGRTDAFLCLFDFVYSLQTPMLPYKDSFNQYRNGKEIEMDTDGNSVN